METKTTIVWFRNDLRLEDNPALLYACKRGVVIPLYIWNSQNQDDWKMGAASRWWLHYSLSALQTSLQEKLGLKLIIREGDPVEVLRQVVLESHSDSLFWNRHYEPFQRMQEDQLFEAFKEKLHLQSYAGNFLIEPHLLENKQGKPFKVFTPFWKAAQFLEIDKPFSLPPTPEKCIHQLLSLSIDSLQLLPRIHWDEGLKETWTPGEFQAKKLLNQFIKKHIDAYAQDRDYPGVSGTSHLSPYLHFGEISVKSIWQALQSLPDEVAAIFKKQLGWREFSNYLLFHFPYTTHYPLYKKFDSFPWKRNAAYLDAWQKGQTGYPIIDAGMRELWHTGWMHNRVRMIVGSFLVKDLMISWIEGAKWFFDTLVDADLANNTMGWQWVAGCGADASPYFRIFNPVLQGKKYDPSGLYIRKWIPELTHLPDKWIHSPWEAPKEILSSVGLNLGDDYPYPIIDHTVAREEALKTYKTYK